DLLDRAVEAVRTLRQLPREHVLHSGRGPRARREADELPGALHPLRLPDTFVSRPAAALRRLRAPPPLRAFGRSPRPYPRALLLPGRRPYLLHARADS